MRYKAIQIIVTGLHGAMGAMGSINSVGVWNDVSGTLHQGHIQASEDDRLNCVHPNCMLNCQPPAHRNVTVEPIHHPSVSKAMKSRINVH